MSARLLFIERTPDPSWSVVTATRPLASLRFGAWTLCERMERWTSVSCSGVVARGALGGFVEERSPGVVTPPPDGGPGGTLLWCSTAIPAPGAARPEVSTRPTLIRVNGRYAGLWLPPGRPLPAPDELPDGRPSAERPAVTADDGEVPVEEVEGEWLDSPWALIDRNSDALAADLDAFHGIGRDGRPTHHRYEGIGGVHIERGHPIWIEEDVDIGPGVVLDAREGAIKLDQGVRVSGPARLVGPLHLSWDTWVLGGTVGTSSIGPVCKVRGEVSDTIWLGWANKAHDGYVGRTLLGRWVNLGAGTITSDLRNDYRSVPVHLADGRVDSGVTKLGAMIGDHVKTGIGTLLTTGATIGAGSMLASGGLAPARVPPMTWVTSRGSEPYRFDRFEQVMRAAMARRYVVPGDGMVSILRRLAAETHGGGGA
jgi:UDP-N-acetylglucosamine diphosphorylase/glucosamine-1-phosphate N-acetyltransferase